MTFQSTIVPRNEGQVTRERAGNGRRGRVAVAPDYEIKESGDAFGLEVFLPGVRRDDLNLSVEGRELALTAARSWQKPQEWNTVWSETQGIDYRLHLTLPEGLEQDNIHAELKDGVLRLTLPKGRNAQRKKIKIE